MSRTGRLCLLPEMLLCQVITKSPRQLMQSIIGFQSCLFPVELCVVRDSFHELYHVRKYFPMTRADIKCLEVNEATPQSSL